MPADRQPAQRAWIEYGRRLRAWRRRAGLTQRQVGDHLGYHHTVISKVEQGLREVPAGAAPRLDRLLRAGGELISVPDARADRPEPADLALAESGFLPLPHGGGTTLVRPTDCGWPTSLPEHGLLCPRHGDTGCAVPGPAAAHQMTVALDERLRRGLPIGSDPDVVHSLAATLIGWSRRGAEETPESIDGPAGAVLRVTMRWARAEQAAGRPPLTSLQFAAHFAQLLGRLQMQRGRRATAMAWFTQGLRWAAVSDQPAARATLLSDMCTLTRLDDDAGGALAYAQALEDVDPTRTWTTLLAHLYQARAYALRGDAAGCHQHLARTRRDRPRLGERDRLEAPWLDGDSGDLRLETGAAGALRDLAVRTGERRAATRAVAASEQALTCATTHTRSTRVLLSLRLADSLACAGDPEQAVATSSAVLAEAISSGRSTITEELRGLRSRLSARWADSAPVRAFETRLSQLS
ncbi:helix-turn-helix transcriptional regulator [Amorphoplanes nipponensis]|uniref:Transcriptional regulator n=1 Tax=Actinoplanes nipponensis TaxID=135950 RepID=A0A919MNJ6_9ACTN|nr:helix-turn-helix transcriptional regulator [Actinoplanes nipponensis]GIE51651.1 transcriptional regulator [Actinoplanes nipponensis]